MLKRERERDEMFVVHAAPCLEEDRDEEKETGKPANFTLKGTRKRGKRFIAHVTS